MPGYDCLFLRMEALPSFDSHARVLPCSPRKRFSAKWQLLEYFISLPIPHILHYGKVEESPKGLGPVIIMEHISNEGDFNDTLYVPGRSRDERPILNPNVSQERLECVYGQMVDIMLQVSKHSFAEIDCIGKANEDDEIDDTWVVEHRPLTFNINELVQLGGVSPDLLHQGTFETALSYYQALAEMHIIHLTFNETTRSIPRKIVEPSTSHVVCFARSLAKFSCAMTTLVLSNCPVMTSDLKTFYQMHNTK